MKCTFCEGDIPATAQACMHCGRMTPEAKARSGNDLMFRAFLIGAGLIAAFFFLMHMGSRADPLAERDRYAAECVRNGANGHWSPTMGPTLEEFCEGAANLNGARKYRP